MDYVTLKELRENNEAWQLLASHSAPAVLAFLHRVFEGGRRRSIPEGELREELVKDPWLLRGRTEGDAAFRDTLRVARDVLDHMVGRRWLRKFYVQGSDEPRLDITVGTEKALAFVESLRPRPFVGAESRLLSFFDLLRRTHEGSLEDPEERLKEIERKRAELDREEKAIRGGNVNVLGETAVRDRFQQLVLLGQGILSDFREMEENFRRLDRELRERIATSEEESKGRLLGETLREYDLISGSEQGRSFAAFYDFLMSEEHQREFASRLGAVLGLDPVRGMDGSDELRDIHVEWSAACAGVNSTVAGLSRQLRRFLDEQTREENRRIRRLLQRVQREAVALRSTGFPRGGCMEMDDLRPRLGLVMARTMFRPPERTTLDRVDWEEGSAEADFDIFFGQDRVDADVLLARVRSVLEERGTASLAEVADRYPLDMGLAELVAYTQLRAPWLDVYEDTESVEEIFWLALDKDGEEVVRRCSAPRFLFSLVGEERVSGMPGVSGVSGVPGESEEPAQSRDPSRDELREQSPGSSQDLSRDLPPDLSHAPARESSPDPSPDPSPEPSQGRQGPHTQLSQQELTGQRPAEQGESR